MAESKRSVFTSLGAALRSLRDDRGWTLRDLELRSDFSFRYLSQIELGQRFPPPETLKSILTALDVDERTRDRIIRIAIDENAQDYRGLLGRAS